MNKNKITNNTKLLALLKRYKKKCCYCGCKTRLIKSVDGFRFPDDGATVEHIYPKMDILKRNRFWIDSRFYGMG